MAVVETPLNVRRAWPSVPTTVTADTFLENVYCERMLTITLILAPAVLTFTLGMFATITTEPLRRWLLRPRLKIHFDNLAACNAKLGDAQVVLPFRVGNLSGKAAMNCRPYLTSVETPASVTNILIRLDEACPLK